MHYLSLAEVSEAIRTQKITSLEVTTALLARIEAFDSSHQPYVTVTAERARARAKQADAEIASGYWRGPLHGVPVSAKDIIDSDFAPTAAGMPLRAGNQPERSATVIERLEDAGAVLLGKVKTAEGAWAETNPPEARPVNPWNANYWPGASSNGSGVSVSLGLGYASIGSCTGGSIRMPAQANGISGRKPTWGRVSRAGVFPLAPSLDHIGPLTRSAEDAAIVLEAIAGRDPRDPSSDPRPVDAYRAACSRSVDGMSIGVDWKYVREGSRPDVVAAVETVLDVMAGLGVRVREIEMPDYRQALDTWYAVLTAEVAEGHRATYPALKDQYGSVLAGLLEDAQATTAGDLARQATGRQAFLAGLDAVFGEVDAIIAPVTPNGTVSLNDLSIVDPNEAEVTKFTAPYNLAGVPTMTVPAGFDRNNMPVAVQFIAPKWGESTACALGAAYQRRTDWHTRHPVD